MTVRLTNNRDEYSRTIARSDGNRLDICCFKHSREFVVAIVNEEDVYVEEIAFSAEELTVLKEHLQDPITQSILGGTSEIPSQTV